MQQTRTQLSSGRSEFSIYSNDLILKRVCLVLCQTLMVPLFLIVLNSCLTFLHAGIDTYRSNNITLQNWDVSILLQINPNPLSVALQVTCGDDCLAIKGVSLRRFVLNISQLTKVIELDEPSNKGYHLPWRKWDRFWVFGTVFQSSEQMLYGDVL